MKIFVVVLYKLLDIVVSRILQERGSAFSGTTSPLDIMLATGQSVAVACFSQPCGLAPLPYIEAIALPPLYLTSLGTTIDHRLDIAV